MKRRVFLAAAAGVGGFGAATKRLAGFTLPELRRRWRQELFERCLPFWDRYGIDHERGGFICSLDYDGTRADTNKQLWFQGRGIWVYSFLYNHFGKDPRHLEVARKTKDFVLRHAPQADGWWAELLSREGKVLRPFSGDIYGMLFVAEGLQEYAWAARDEEARRTAVELLKKLAKHAERPQFRMAESDVPGRRPQGLWMVNLRIATQMLRRWQDPEIAALADRCLTAIIDRHYNPEIGLNNEVLNFDFSRPPEEATKSLLGHSVETLWMVMDEADRRKDEQLWITAAERVKRHLEVGWDPVYGGLVEWVNVGQGSYQWPVDRPVGTDLEFRFTGEYFYMKPLWALHEILVAALMVWDRAGSEWAGRYFELAYELMESKFSMQKRGLAGYMLFADRRMTRQEHVRRQDNYHPPRQLMLNLLRLERMLRRGG